MICEKCKASISETAKFCPKCGAKVEIAKAEVLTKKCPSCGVENPISAKFCKVDGYNFQQTEGRPAEEIKPEIEKPKDVILCPRCGAPNPLTAKFCKKDGAPLREEIKPSEVVKEYIKPERIIEKKPKEIATSKARRIPIRIAISLLIIIILVGAGSYLYFFKKTKDIPLPHEKVSVTPETPVLSELPQAPEQEVITQKPNIGIITGDGVLIRKDPSITSAIIGRLNREDRVTILKKWKVDNPNEAIIIENTKLVTKSEVISLNRGKAILITGQEDSYYTVCCNIEGKEIEGTVPVSAVRRIYGETWYNVKTEKKETGWVFGEFVKESWD